MQKPANVKEETAPVILYGQELNGSLDKQLKKAFSGQNIEIVETCTQAELLERAINAVLIIFIIEDHKDKNCFLTSVLRENPDIVCDICAVSDSMDLEDRLKIMAGGFDYSFPWTALDNPDCQKIIQNKIQQGRLRLKRRIREQEYDKFQALLSISPDAFIVFDEDKKLFFVSEHYKRAYPKNADKLVRGLHVNDAYEMLSAEHGVFPGDPRYEPLKKFWASMDGEVEVTLDGPQSLRVIAKKLPDSKGYIVITTDITDYMAQKKILETQSKKISDALRQEQKARALQQRFIHMVSNEFRTPLDIIDGNVQILQRREGAMDKESMDERCTIIRDAVARLIHLMEEGGVSDVFLSDTKKS